MRANYFIDSAKLNLGPTDIQQVLPQSGQFKPSRGAAVIFPTQYIHDGRFMNVTENWTWNLIIEGEPIYDTLKALDYKGNDVLLTTEYGEDNGTPVTYSGEIVDIVFEYRDGITFKNNKRGYRCTMIVNTWS